MPGWYYEKRELLNTPSYKDGIDPETEGRYRREGARFIIDVGGDLNLRYDTVATGSVYFHRFYMLHSFKEFNKYVTALGCLFLAGKVEETPKKCKDLLRVARQRLSDEDFAAFGDDPREEVMAIERVLLQTIKFDLQLEHPYQFLIKYAKTLKGPKDKTDIERLVQMAWTFINDSLCTTICLEFEPEIVAIALMYLATRLGKCTISDWGGRRGLESEHWWDQFVEDLTEEHLEAICHKVLDLYSSSTGAAVTDKSQPPVTSAKGSTGSTPSSTPASKVSPSTPTMITPTRQEQGQAKLQPVLSTTVVGHVPPKMPPMPLHSNQPPPPPMPAQIIPPHHFIPNAGPPPAYAYPVSMPPAQPIQRPVYAYPPPPSLTTPPPAAGPPYSYYAQPPPQAYSVPPPRPMHPDYSPRIMANVPPTSLYPPQRGIRHPPQPGSRY